jgi:hypothetical protein
MFANQKIKQLRRIIVLRNCKIEELTEELKIYKKRCADLENEKLDIIEEHRKAMVEFDNWNKQI